MVKLAAPRGHLWSCLTLTFAFAGVTIRFPRDWYLIIYFASHCRWIFEDEMLPHQVSASLRAQNIQKISKHQACARPQNVQISLVHCVSILQILRHVWPLHFDMTQDRCQKSPWINSLAFQQCLHASGTYTDALPAYLVSLCRVRKTWFKVVGLNNFTPFTCTCTPLKFFSEVHALSLNQLLSLYFFVLVFVFIFVFVFSRTQLLIAGK